jgi:hypothetical protein
MNNAITEDRIVSQGFTSARSSSFLLTANKVSRRLNTSYFDVAVSRRALLLNLDLKQTKGTSTNEGAKELTYLLQNRTNPKLYFGHRARPSMATTVLHLDD